MTESSSDRDRAASDYVAQGIIEHFAVVLQGLLGQSYDDFEGLGLNEDNNIVLTPEQGSAVAEALADALPRCFSNVPGRTPTCQIPDGVCHPCAADGRSLPKDHPLRATEEIL